MITAAATGWAMASCAGVALHSSVTAIGGTGSALTPAGCPDDYDNEPAPIVAPLDCAACENTGYLTTGDFCECKAGQRKARQVEDGPTRWHDRHYAEEAKAAGGVLVITGNKEAA